MRQALLGLVGVLAAGAACAESYSFMAEIQDACHEQTTIKCNGPKLSERVPKGCMLSERSIAYPNYQMSQRSSPYTAWPVRLGIRLSFIPMARWLSVRWTLSCRWLCRS